MTAVRRFALASSRVLTAQGLRPAVVIVAGETIEQVVERGRAPDLQVEDLDPWVISPGVVDAHVHINEPGRTDWEGFASATRAAAAGGVTTLVDMPLNSTPVTTTVGALQAKRDAARAQCQVDVAFYGGLVPGNQDDLAELVEAGVCGVKAFMCDSGLADFPASPPRLIEEAMRRLAPWGIPLLVHAELPDKNATPAAAIDTLPELAEARRGWEERAVRALVHLAEETGCPTHIVHVSSAGALQLIREAKQNGLPITAETCPHYLTFCLEEMPGDDPLYKCMPPILDRENREQLWEAIERGTIDTIGSDHSPCPAALKQTRLADAWGGISSLELTLPAVWTGMRSRELPLELLGRVLSENPAQLIGWEGRKGRIAPGYDADLCVWDPDQRWTVEGSRLQHRSPLTPYDGVVLHGKVARTYVRGQVAYERGEFARAPEGNLLSRAPVATGGASSPQASTRLANFYNGLPADEANRRLTECCAARQWVEQMQRRLPVDSDEHLFEAARVSAALLSEADWLEAFAAHPQIGDLSTLRQKYAATETLAASEQAGALGASEPTLQELAAKNREYFEKNGFLFIVFATGKTAGEMLQLLNERLDNPRAQELQTAAAEQLKITLLRLRKAVE